jgi:hypothetical protein
MRPPARTSASAAAALAALAVAGCGSSGDSGVATFPMAKTPDASPRTTISFRGIGPGKLTGVTVKGSRTGAHPGTLRPHPDGHGVSFVPKRGFKPGETVTVDAKQKLLGEQDGAVQFKIALAPRLGVPAKVQKDPAGHPVGEQHFHSRPDLLPPSVKIEKRTAQAAPGALFLTPKAGPGADGTVITDTSGGLIWFKQVPAGNSTFDLRVQRYEGKPVLTWWQGEVHHGQGQGAGMIYDSSYEKLAEVPPGNGYRADFHEFQLSRDGRTAFFVIYEPVRYDLRRIGGPKDGSVIDGIVQEVDIKTGLVLFEWHTLGSVDLGETYAKVPKKAPLDVSHVNSIYEEKDGNLLVSARDMHSALELNRKTGGIEWRLGGKDSDYDMGEGTRFVGQHDIRRAPNGDVTVFDNGSPPTTKRTARAIALHVDDGGKKVTLAHAFHRTPPFISPSQGNVDALPNGNFMVGWGGDVPFFDEYTPTGAVAIAGSIVPPTDDTYRVWHMPWTARPKRPPDVAAQPAGGQTDVWASWNGATEVRQWQVLTGTTADSLTPGQKAARTGFETQIVVPGSPAFVAVRALDAAGRTLATSQPVQPGA